MSATPESIPQPEADPLEVAADQTIAACGGDMRSAIRALILANDYFEVELAKLQAATSLGYARRKQPVAPLPADRKDWYDE